MNFNLLLITICFCVISSFVSLVVDASSSSSPSSSLYKKPLADYLPQWQEYKSRFNKHYSSQSEDSYRFRLFVSRLPENNAQLRKIQEMNPRAVFGSTKFSDLTDREWNRMRGRRRRSSVEKQKRQSPAPPLDRERLNKFLLRSETERSVNWTARGVTTFVRNQKNCGCCWSISTVECIEARHDIKGLGKVILSEQQLISCDTEDFGCDGSEAYSDTANWIVDKNNGTLDTWESYPFSSGDGKAHRCEQHSSTHKRVIGARNIQEGYVVPSDADEINRVLVDEGPVQISIDSNVLQNYVSGIIDNSPCHPANVDHEVLITGSSTRGDDGKRFWIVKNSWGQDWGYSGYFHVAQDSTNQMCINTWPYMWRIGS